MEEEIWKDIPSYEGIYQISSYGRVRNLVTSQFIKGYKVSKGYLRVDLFKDGIRKHHRVHRLVAEAFIPNPNRYREINHKNGIKTDNTVDNLEWCTTQMNIEHAWGNGLYCRGKYTKWTDEKCIEAAKTCSTFREFNERFPGGYKYAHRGDLWKSFIWYNLTDEVINKSVKVKKKKNNKNKLKPRIVKKIYITLEDCIEKAIKCRTWNEFAKRYEKRAKYCRAEGFVDLIKEEIRKNNPDYKPQNYYNIDIDTQKQICLEKAQLCQTKVEFRTKYKHEYGVASANRWLKEYTWLTGCKGVKDEEKKNKAIEVARQCITKREFREEHPVEYSLAVKYKILKEFTWLKGCKKEK